MRVLSKVACGFRYLLAKARVKIKNARRMLLTSPSDIDWDRWIDRFIDPIIWIVDNFSGSLGLIFVSIVWLLIIFIVGIAYWLGIPYYWSISAPFTILLILFGHWILLNVIFHYYMALKTPPGYPPQAVVIPQISARCKKCSAAKPPRTHHCSVCKTCILRMDHHCPWLNNCVGHYNHRYFYLFMAYVVLGMIFLYIFGAPVLFYELSVDDSSEPIGQRVMVNATHILPLEPDSGSDEKIVTHSRPKSYRRGLIITEAILCSGILAALGTMIIWHGKLITNGETSIENLTNKFDRDAAMQSGVIFRNPFDHGPLENWRIFLGLYEGRSWACVFFPSAHSPRGNGIDWGIERFETP